MNLPITQQEPGYRIPTDGMAPGLAIMFDDRLYQRCRDMASDMSKAEGFTPPHLLGKAYACFAVLTRAITWKLDPLAVAQSTYQTPGGRIGYEGKLVQAILENSGKFEGPIRFEHFGDWSKIRGKWKKGQSAKGHTVPQQAWTDAEEEGLGVIVRAKVKGESEERTFTMYLRECFPRNSTLWPLRPEQQICYTAVRAFGNIAAAGILMGVPFDTDAEAGTMIDVTPTRPQRSGFDKITDKPATATSHDETTGEIADEVPAKQIAEEAETEFGPADAYAMGAEARSKTGPKTPPADWDGPDNEALREAYVAGWEAENEKIQAALKGGK